MKAFRWGMGIVGLLLALLAVWQILSAARGLEITTLRSSRSPTVPVAIIAPRGEAAKPRPLVLIAHGFAGSGVVMRGFAFTLAHAGYTVVLWDFEGHGANPRPLGSGMGGDALLADAEAALRSTASLAVASARARGLGEGGVAILGHSMGSGVALAFGQKYPDTAATIAVSPVGRTVTPELPHNLLLMAGSLEAPFVRTAEQQLAQAGGAGGDPAAGTARKMLIIPGVEHVSILFSPAAHAAAREWLDATFGPQPGATIYTDRRVIWYGVGLLGILLLAAALAQVLVEASPPMTTRRPLWRRLAALAGGALGATLALWLAGLAGLGLRDLLGLLVGGYLLLWFGVAGLLSLLLLWVRPSWPSRRALLGRRYCLGSGLLAFAALWLGVGLLGQLVWLPWLLIPRRLALWPLGALLLLPWFLAAGEAARDTRPLGRIGWWLADSIAVGGALYLALTLSPDLGFLTLILPLFPIILGLQALAAAPYRGSWPFALSGALFTSWLLLAVFPLS